MPRTLDTLVGASLLNRYDLLSTLPPSYNESRFLAVDNANTSSLRHARLVEIRSRQKVDAAVQRQAFEDVLDYDHHLKGHSFIRSVDRIVEDEKGFHVIYGTFAGGRLGLTLNETPFDSYDAKSIKSLISDLFTAVMHSHSRGVFHRNINFSTVVSANKHLFLENFENASTDTNSRELVALDRSFCPPESLSQVCKIIGYSCAASDSWALGILLFFLLTRRKPWEEATLSSPDYCMFRADKDSFFRPFGFTEEVSAFFAEVFHYHEPLRPSVQQMYQRVRKMDRFLVARPTVQVRRPFKPRLLPAPTPIPTPQKMVIIDQPKGAKNIVKIVKMKRNGYDRLF